MAGNGNKLGFRNIYGFTTPSTPPPRSRYKPMGSYKAPLPSIVTRSGRRVPADSVLTSPLVKALVARGTRRR